MFFNNCKNLPYISLYSFFFGGGIPINSRCLLVWKYEDLWLNIRPENTPKTVRDSRQNLPNNTPGTSTGKLYKTYSNIYKTYKNLCATCKHPCKTYKHLYKIYKHLYKTYKHLYKTYNNGQGGGQTVREACEMVYNPPVIKLH